MRQLHLASGVEGGGHRERGEGGQREGNGEQRRESPSVSVSCASYIPVRLRSSRLLCSICLCPPLSIARPASAPFPSRHSLAASRRDDGSTPSRAAAFRTILASQSQPAVLSLWVPLSTILLLKRAVIQRSRSERGKRGEINFVPEWNRAEFYMATSSERRCFEEVRGLERLMADSW